MSDLVERLREWSVFGYGYEASCDMKEAATAIEAQQANMANAARLLSEQTAEIERLRAALYEVVHGWETPMDDKAWRAVARFMWDKARAALEEK